jgi:hypothetical protein
MGGMKMKRKFYAFVLTAAVSVAFALGASAQMMGGGTSSVTPDAPPATGDNRRKYDA